VCSTKVAVFCQCLDANFYHSDVAYQLPTIYVQAATNSGQHWCH